MGVWPEVHLDSLLTERAGAQQLYQASSNYVHVALMPHEYNLASSLFRLILARCPRKLLLEFEYPSGAPGVR